MWKDWWRWRHSINYRIGIQFWFWSIHSVDDPGDLGVSKLCTCRERRGRGCDCVTAHNNSRPFSGIFIIRSCFTSKIIHINWVHAPNPAHIHINSLNTHQKLWFVKYIIYYNSRSRSTAYLIDFMPHCKQVTNGKNILWTKSIYSYNQSAFAVCICGQVSINIVEINNAQMADDSLTILPLHEHSVYQKERAIVGRIESRENQK